MSAQAPHRQEHGAAASASKYRRNGGTEDKSSSCCYIPGEGWVKWSEINAQVTKAFGPWLARRAFNGYFSSGFSGRIDNDIAEALSARRRKQETKT